jgi:DNA invertase Pin-like site-specific DNA recombinase
MKVALYARVSKSDKDKDGKFIQNPENQLIRLKKYAQEKGYVVKEEYIYIDRASGADPNREHLERMCRDARANRFSLILAVKLDRIARSMSNFHDLLKEWEAIGVKFHCVDQPEVSTDSSMGRLLMNILGAIAEFERELIRERTLAGLERAKAKGSKLGRRPKTIDFEKVRELKAQGWGIRRIAKELKIAPETLRRGLRNEGGKTAREKPDYSGG